MFEVFKKCPLCKSALSKPAKLGYPNRYSELISTKLNISEKTLLIKLKNVECENCGLIYKKKWLEKKFLEKLFNEYIPIHPKGWDKLSDKFSKNYFIKQINRYTDKEKTLSILNKNFLYRDILSLCDSVDDDGLKKNQIEFKYNFIKEFKKGNRIFLKKKNLLFSKLITTPSPFKRFSGFGNDLLIDYYKKFSPKILNYAEIGCPLWGNFDKLRSNKKRNLFFFKPKRHDFWSGNCYKKGKNCSNKIQNFCKVAKYEELGKQKEKFDFLSAFLILDHSTEPLKMLNKINKNSKCFSILIEDMKKGVPAQHFSGWSKKTMNFIGKKLNKKIDMSFKPLQKIGYYLFLFY
tara:strand:+ start:919 stop:1962 length:1044 start_codon:yes stop_codon:yes gene_type:complete